MPYRIEIPTNCIRRVSYPPRTQSPPVHGQSAMMLYAGCDRRLQSGRLMNMEGPGWPNSAGRRTEATNRREETPRRNWPYRNESTRYSASAFASPTFSQIHRESLASPPSHQQTAQVQTAPRSHLEADGERKLAHPGQDVEHQEPFPAPGLDDWRNGGTSFEDHQFSDDYVPYDHPLAQALPMSIGHGRSLFPFDNAQAPPLAEAQYEDVPHAPEGKEDHGNAPDELFDSNPPLVPVRLRVYPSRRNASRRNSGRGRGGRDTPHPTTAARHSSQHRRPCSEEIESCSTNRAREALNVWYQRYNELVDYKRKEGHCNVPQKYEKNPALGIW